LTIRPTAPKDVQQFDLVSLRLDVLNPGAMEVKDVEVTVALPEGVTHQYDAPPSGRPVDPKNNPRMRQWSVGRLGPNEMRSLDYRIVAERPGPVVVTMLAVSSNGTRADGKADITVQAPKLELSATGPAQRASHQPAVYRISVKNAGTYPMRNITVSDRVPAQSQLVSATEGGLNFEQQVQWIVPALQPGETRVMELTAKQPLGGAATHQFTATYRGARQSAEVTTNFATAAALRLDLKGTPETAELNGTVRFTVTMENTGSAPATNVRPNVTLPAEVTFTSAEPATYRQEGLRIAFEPATIPVGGRQVYSVTVRADKPTATAITVVEMLSDQLEAGPLRRQETTAIANR
jgi:uncharacterized repeat protein (TIGR01451 family)